MKELYQFHSNYCDVDSGNSIFYIDEGTGPMIVMIHDCPMSSFEFRLEIHELSKCHRVIAYDQIGFGLSDTPNGRYEYGISKKIELMERLLYRIGVEDEMLTLLMHGRGSAIGVGFAEKHPEQIRSLIVMNAPSFSCFHIPYRLFLFQSKNLSFFLFPVLKKILSPPRKLPPVVRHAYTNCLTRKSRIPLFHFIESLPDVPESSYYRLLLSIEIALWTIRKKPMLILWGEKDWLYNHQDAKKWREYFPEAEFHFLPHAGRYLTEEAPMEILQYIKNFLDLESQDNAGEANA